MAETKAMGDSSAAESIPGDGRPSRRRVAVGVFVTTCVMVPIVRSIGNSRALGFDGFDLFAAAPLVGLAVLAAMLPRRQALWAGVALAATWLLAYVLYDQLPGPLGGSVPVDEAVGAASYYGTPYIGQQLAAFALIVMTGVVATLLARRPVRLAPASTAADTVVEPQPTRRARRLTVLATALVVLTRIPNLREQLVAQSYGPLPEIWDVTNQLTVGFFQQQGLRPMEDFWFPYGNQWVFNDFPLGPAAMFLWQALLLSLAAWALSRLIGPRPGRIAFCLLAIVAVGLFDIAGILIQPTVWRYAPGLVVALVYAAVGPLNHRTPGRGHGVLLVACAATAAMAFDVFTVALGGILFVALGAIALNATVGRRSLVRAAAVDLLPVIGGATFMLACWAVAGTFAENVRWYGDFLGSSAYHGAPQQLQGALLHLDVNPSVVLVLAAIPALLLVMAFVYGRLPGRTEHAVSAILFAAAGVSSVILAKHMIRPQGPVLLYPPLMALGMCAVLLWNAKSVRSWVAVALFAGALCSLLHPSGIGRFTVYASHVLLLPVTIADNLALIKDGRELRAAKKARFAPERFAASGDKKYIADPLAHALRGPGQSRFAVLGDSSLLYMLFDQKAPWHVQMFNMSPIDEQRTVTAALERMEPRHLVWRRDYKIDGVPYEVRAPLVFAYAIQRYVPEKNGDPWDLLRQRKPGEPPALGFWRARLGETVDLGGIPSYSRGADAESCDGGPACAPYAVVTGKPAKDGEKIVIDVRAGRRHFKVALTGYEDDTRYSVRLDRLWFWPFVATGATLSTATPGWQVRRVDVDAGDDLY